MSVISPERAKVWPSRNCKGCKGFSEKTGKTQLKRLGVSHPNHVQIENYHFVVARVKLTTPLEGASLATHGGIQRIIENKRGHAVLTSRDTFDCRVPSPRKNIIVELEDAL
jgi:hypothetical protein